MTKVLSEKEIIREKVRAAWERTKYDSGDSELNKIRLNQWVILDNLWCDLYDEEY